MKRKSFIIRLMLAGLFLGLMVVACQKDTLTEEPNPANVQTLQFQVPDIPAEIAQHFTEEELAAFRAGPAEAMRNEVETRFGAWHPISMLGTAEIFHRPVLNSCEDPIICTNLVECSNPALWVGYAEPFSGEGMWFGMGTVTFGNPGTIFCGTGETYKSTGWTHYGDGEMYSYVTAASTVAGNDGSHVIISRHDVTGGTGSFEGAFGYYTSRLYAHQDDLPNIFTGAPGHFTVYVLGWVYY